MKTGAGNLMRSEFIRAGASTSAVAAAFAVPLLGAGSQATVRIGYVDSFSGIYAASGAAQDVGIRTAIAEAERKTSRVRYELVRGDDNGKPAIGTIEARRLILNERVDVVLGCVSSAVALAISAVCEETGVPFLAIGTHDTNITGAKANRVTFRTCPNNRMLSKALAPALYKFGTKWYFIVADYAFGRDGYERLRADLEAFGGTEVGADLHPLGAIEYAPYMVKARNTKADVMVFCNYGPDTQNALQAFVGYGLHKRMRVGGINAGDEVAPGMPLDDIVGSVWGYDWGPDASERSAPIYRMLSAANGGVTPNWRNYLGYIAASQYIDRLGSVGTTDTEALIKAFEGHRFNGGKASDSMWRACDHQNVQETYAARILPKRKRGKTGGFFEIGERLDGVVAAGDCDNPDSAKAAAIMRTQTIMRRDSRRIG